MSKITKFGSLYEEEDGTLVFKDFSLKTDNNETVTFVEATKILRDLIVQRMDEAISEAEAEIKPGLDNLKFGDLKWEFKK